MTETATKQLDPTADGAITFMHPLDAKEDPENAEQRSITATSLERLKYALEKAPAMMLARPVIVDTSAVAVGGNHRLRAAREMIGDAEYPEFNKWVSDHHGIPFFIRAFESAAERREWRIRDNADYASWEEGALAELATLHRDEGGDLSLLGLDEPQLDALLADAAGEGGDGGGPAGPDPLPDVWGVVVECENEAQQSELLEDLNRRGFQCRALL